MYLDAHVCRIECTRVRVTYEQYRRLIIIFNITIDLKLNVTLENIQVS